MKSGPRFSSIHGHLPEVRTEPSLDKIWLTLTCVLVIKERKGKKKLDFMETRYAMMQ